MDQSRNIELAQQFIAGISQGADPDTITSLFRVDAVIEIPGDVGVLPWIGQKTGRQAIAELLVPNAEIEHLIFSRADDAQIERAAVAAGMVTMFDAGILAALEGVTTVEEVARSIRAVDALP